MTRTVMAPRPWEMVDGLFMFLMWAIMMVGMMLPSAAPMTLLYAGMVRKAERQGTPMAPTAAFVSGYLAMWCLFSVGATLAQWGLHEAAMLSPMMMAKSQVFGSGSSYCGWSVSTDSLENRVLGSLSSPCAFYSGTLATGSQWCLSFRTSSRRVLFGMLLGFDGTVVCGWGDEFALDRGDYDLCLLWKKCCLLRLLASD